MKSFFFFISPFVLSGIIFSACEKEYEPVPEYLENIYPIEEGHAREYAAIDTVYNLSFGEGRAFFRKEETKGKETDLLGRKVNVLWIYESNDSLDSSGTHILNYEFNEVWNHYKDQQFVERSEGATRFVVLKLPPMEGTSWNSNFYNSEEDKTSRVLSHDTSLTIQGKFFSNCVFVLKNPFFLVSNDQLYIREYAYEIYAPGVGKIIRHEESLHIQNPGPGQVIDFEKSHYFHEELYSWNY